MKLIYVAHKYGGKKANSDAAERWTARLNLHINGAIFIAPWLPMVREWIDSGPLRERGLMLDLECVRKCDGIILIGEMSPGMTVERDAAIASGLPTCRLVIDDPFGAWHPSDMVPVQTWIDLILSR